MPAAPPLRTLAIDIGGTGVKALVLDANGKPPTERQRIDTPHPATPAAILAAIAEVVKPLGAFDRISAGFPGVVKAGVVHTAPNLDPAWAGFPLQKTLEKRLGKPARVLNDAGVQGYGLVSGHGVEMVLTLGTGLGCALFLDGHYVPNLELAHHPFRKEMTYEDYVGAPALHQIGKKKWNKRVLRVLEQIQPIWNPDRIYLGGGNTKHLTVELPKHVKKCENVAGLLGGIALWHDQEAPGPVAHGEGRARRPR